MIYDVAVIGCGVVGAAVAYELSKYQLSVVIFEKENDVAQGTTKANSAIIHAGYDPEPGTLMAKLNVRGSQMMPQLVESLGIEYKQTGSLVLAFYPDEQIILQNLMERGLQNGVEGLRILTGEKVRQMEPNLSEKVRAALYAPTAAIVSPWELCYAMAQVAVRNGVEICLESTVTGIERTGGRYLLHTTQGDFVVQYVINAAGVCADIVHNMISKPAFRMLPSKGQYYMLDKSQGKLVDRVIFQCPTEVGKGILVAPTVHGNLIVGPNAEEILDVQDMSTSAEGLFSVRREALRSVPGINFRDTIRNFAGVRAATDQKDFIIGQVEDAPGFIDLAGIKSPGLSSAPAIAEMSMGILQKCGLPLMQKQKWDGTRRIVRFKELSAEEKSRLIEQEALFGRVICRCETITEGEIVAALHAPIPPRTIDAVKRRCGTGMGRCQGGFCGPRVHEIISRELGMPMQEVLQGPRGSVIITGETKRKGDTEDDGTNL